MPEITVYSRKACGPCMTVKYWLDKKNIPYQVKDLDENPSYADEAYRASGYSAVPVTVVGDQAIVGPNFPLLSKALMV